MKLFDFVPSWLWAAVVAGLVTTNLIGNARLSSERLAHQTTKTAHAGQVAAAEKSRADEEAKRRQTEQDLAEGFRAVGRRVDQYQFDAGCYGEWQCQQHQESAGKPRAGGVLRGFGWSEL